MGPNKHASTAELSNGSRRGTPRLEQELLRYRYLPTLPETFPGSRLEALDGHRDYRFILLRSLAADEFRQVGSSHPLASRIEVVQLLKLKPNFTRASILSASAAGTVALNT